MEDSNLWYYLVLGLIYFLSKAFGKKKKKPRPSIPQEGSGETHPDQAAPEFSFEDILKELTGRRTPAEKSIPVPIEPEGLTSPEPLPQTNYPAYSSDEMDSIASAPFQSTSTYSAGLKASVKRKRRKDDSFERESNYLIKEYEAVDYTQLLNEENGPARAFVMHEIFTKKY